jgi:hypothetical protein
MAAAHSQPAATAGYPAGYRDPPWDGTEAGYAAVVLPARAAAIEQALNECLAGQLPAGTRITRGRLGETAEHSRHPGTVPLRPLAADGERERAVTASENQGTETAVFWPPG